MKLLIHMAREFRNLASYLVLSLFLIGAAELAVAVLDTPRLWALMATFTLGYAILAVVKWRVHARRTPSSDADQPEAQATSNAGSEAGARDSRVR